MRKPDADFESLLTASFDGGEGRIDHGVHSGSIATSLSDLMQKIIRKLAKVISLWYVASGVCCNFTTITTVKMILTMIVKRIDTAWVMFMLGTGNYVAL